MEGKGPYRVPDYQITKGALDPEIMPDEPVILRSTIEDIENHSHKIDLKKRRSIEMD